MEGFVANTVILCIEEASDTNEYNNEFYKKVIKDNMMIFEITPESKVTIPQMKINDLKDILFKKLKINKVCDVYMLTVNIFAVLEMNWLNAIIKNINILSCAKLNTSVASVVHKRQEQTNLSSEDLQTCQSNATFWASY